MDRTFANPLCIPRLARIAEVSEAHFIRTFRATFGETPHRYLQRRRVERAMFLLRATDRSITDICFDVTTEQFWRSTNGSSHAGMTHDSEGVVHVAKGASGFTIEFTPGTGRAAIRHRYRPSRSVWKSHPHRAA